MKIDLRVDRGSLRRWHQELAQRLTNRGGCEVGFRLEEGAGAAKAAGALFQIETLLFGLRRDGVSQRLKPQPDAAAPSPRDAYLVIDLADAPARTAERVWRVECDGAGLEAGLLAALVAGRSPTVRVLGPAGPIAVARPGTDAPGLVKTAFEDMLARVATLIEAALDGAAATPPPAIPGEPAQAFDAAALAPRKWLARAARTVKSRAMRAAYTTLCHAPHWRTGWRRSVSGLAADGRLGAGWTDLPDDGKRFYADPFPVVWRGRTFLFVEDFAHELGKGVISAVEFGPQGPLGAPQPVLERPGHLSYPNVFERDGEMWMIPESGAAGTIDLFRALDFPHSWALERTLVADVVASDATLHEQDGRWWMFATVHDGGGAFSDALWLWSAPDFRGPWTPHRANPVLIDIATSRPAGRMFARDGALYRPVQDCRAGYGAALALARVDRLDEGGFAQSVEAIVRPCAHWPGRRLHTFNAAGGYEFVDGSALAPRWAALRRPLELARRRETRLAPA
ncbi:MAG: formyl transferase [Pseudomonadota bacterium]|nr:formyl transferase [Pseudomonadota bacterium]